ncbi:hypothetical protein V8E53_013984 [Lactarius tabidus]
MALVHDDDLARLDGIFDRTGLPDGLQSDVLLSHIRSLKPTIHNARIDIFPARNGASANTESAWVATLSNVFATRSPASTPSAPQNFHVGSPLRRERQARPRLFSVSCASFYVFIFVPSFLIPLPLFHPLPLPSSWSSSPSFSPSVSFIGLLLLNTLLVSIFSCFFPFCLSSSRSSLFGGTSRANAIVRATLRGLKN